MRKSSFFLSMAGLMTALLLAIFLDARARQRAELPLLRQSAQLVRRLELTDLCLFTEAQYTRNPAVTVLHTPFQDHPLSLEHFPSGSLVGPPPRSSGDE